MPSGASKQEPKARARTVFIDDATWEQLLEIGFRSKPRVSASELVRQFIDSGLERRNGKQGERS